MFPITSRRLFFPAVLALALLAEVLILRTTWRADTQADPKLRKLQVRSGYELVLESAASKSAQPILSYNSTHEHDHRLTISVAHARLSDESLRLLSIAHPATTSGQLIYGPDPSESKSNASTCLSSLRVDFPPATTRHARSVTIAPPKPEDVLNRANTRLIHLSSSFPLALHVSANSPDGKTGPGCRNLLSIGTWQQVIGKDLELGFIVDPLASVNLALSSKSFHSGKDELESLEIEPLLPYRLSTKPLGLSRVVQSRVFAGDPPLKLTDLRLGGDFFDVELTGRAGIPLPEFLGWTTWPMLLLIDVPLLVLAIKVFYLRKTVFISYSRSDLERVLPYCRRFKEAGLEVWIDREGLNIGDQWERKIRAVMLKSRHIVIFISHSVNDGGYLFAEIGLARVIATDRSKHDGFIIPVRLEAFPLPPILSPWNALDLFEPDAERLLVTRLGGKPIIADPTKPAALSAANS
jgi:hypothetical protein